MRPTTVDLLEQNLGREFNDKNGIRTVWRIRLGSVNSITNYPNTVLGQYKDWGSYSPRAVGMPAHRTLRGIMLETGIQVPKLKVLVEIVTWLGRTLREKKGQKVR
ncbi:hypothetical protein Moror_16689 [Moniliophthora roreri MCA 2997]|uniref:Uncharacterized protein n=1 Tax=Moniliophthora roreri (strain MCA 2997) TaxID=1381753 RepID=V2X199_MONRO|nr:hypothetical protein Moror_16689 [Moniliophthora roreri MCA 2997]